MNRRTNSHCSRARGLAVGPDFLDEPVVQFLLPFACQKRLDFGAAGDELVSVAPEAVRGVGQGDASRVTAVPSILRGTNFLDRNGGKGGRFTEYSRREKQV